MGYFAGAATPAAPRARIGLAKLHRPESVPESGVGVRPDTFTFAPERKKLRQARRREGRYRPGSKLPGEDPVQLWICDIQLTEVEQAFRGLKGHLAIRAIYHPRDVRTEWRIHGSLSSGALRASKWVGLHHRHFAPWVRKTQLTNWAPCGRPGPGSLPCAAGRAPGPGRWCSTAGPCSASCASLARLFPTAGRMTRVPLATSWRQDCEPKVMAGRSDNGSPSGWAGTGAPLDDSGGHRDGVVGADRPGCRCHRSSR